jgi:hypothetical protein
MKGPDIDMPFSCFSKEIQEYTRACEHLISESMRGRNQFSEEELRLVKYYTDEVVRTVMGKPFFSERSPIGEVKAYGSPGREA